MTFIVTTFNTTTLSIMDLYATLSIKTLSIMALNTLMLIVIYAEYHDFLLLCWVSLCWMSLCWISLCWVSWRMLVLLVTAAKYRQLKWAYLFIWSACLVYARYYRSCWSKFLKTNMVEQSTSLLNNHFKSLKSLTVLLRLKLFYSNKKRFRFNEEIVASTPLDCILLENSITTIWWGCNGKTL